MKRFTKTMLAAAMFIIAAPIFAATDASNNKVNVSPAERGKIEEVVRQYLLKNPEVIIEAVQNYQKKQYEQAEQTVKQTQQIASSFAKPLFHDTNDPVAGNPNGKITVVEFFDYQCPHCIDMASIIDGAIKNDQDVRFVFKEFPIRGAMSNFAARAALAANIQGKYYEFSHALLDYIHGKFAANEVLTEDGVYEVAKKTGLDVDKLKKDMNDKAIADQLKANIKLAQDLKLFGTPAFFVGKTTDGTINYIPGQMDKNQLQDAINKAKE